MRDRVAVVTPWYPSLARPFHGSFVRGFVDTLVGELDLGVDVLHLESWGLPAGAWAQRRSLRDLARIVRAPLEFDSDRRVAVRHLPAPVRPGQEFGVIADEQRRFLATTRRGAVLPHRVVHAHVGLGGGWPALEVLAPGARFFVTEHATFLERLFADPAAVANYDQVIGASTGFLCVSELLRAQLVERFPHHADRLMVVPNAIDFDRLPVRVREPRDPRRWLYAGSLTERKGVRRLVEAFAIAHADDPSLSLTLVGDGPERENLERRVAELELERSVSMPGATPPERMPDVYASHDLLVHLSDYETFGMTMVEAVATGIPVLVTRCGGPEETVGPIEAAVGCLVDRDASPEEIARAFGELRARTPGLQLEEGREDLRRRYGTAAVASILGDLYAGKGRP